MSKINYTPNLGLITYSGEVIPTYLADTTRNMEILDNVVGKLNTENPSIDARLETLEDDVQKVMSTQHVQIAKFTAYQVATDARLDKLEKDVSDISPEGIQDIRDRLTNAEADIQSNSAVTQALTERVSGDEGVIATNTARIDVLELQFGEGGEYDFSALEDKVTTLGDDVSRIDSELDSLSSDISGADGIQKKLEVLNGEVDGLQISNTTQANQIETLANQVETLESKINHNVSVETIIAFDIDAPNDYSQFSCFFNFDKTNKTIISIDFAFQIEGADTIMIPSAIIFDQFIKYNAAISFNTPIESGIIDQIKSTGYIIVFYI